MNLLSQPPKPHPAFNLEILNSADLKVTFRLPALFLLFIVLFHFAFFFVVVVINYFPWCVYTFFFTALGSLILSSFFFLAY